MDHNYQNDYGPCQITNKMINYLTVNPFGINYGNFIVPTTLCALFLSNCVFGSKFELYYKLSNVVYQFTISMYNVEYLLHVRKLINQTQIQFVNEYITYFDNLMFKYKLIEPYKLNEPEYITIPPETLFTSFIKENKSSELNNKLIEEPKYVTIPLETLFMSSVTKSSIILNENTQQIKYTNISLNTLFKSCSISHIKLNNEDIVMYKKSVDDDSIQTLDKLTLSYYKISGIEKVFSKLHTKNMNNDIYILGIGYGNRNGQDWDIQPYISESVLQIKNNKKYDEPFDEAALRGLMEECSLKLIDPLSITDYKSIQSDNSTIYSINAKHCIGCNPQKLSVNNSNVNKDNKKKKAGVVIYGQYEDLEPLLNVCYPYDETENISYYGIIPLNLLKNRYHYSSNGCNLEISSSLGNIQTAFVKKFAGVYTKK